MNEFWDEFRREIQLWPPINGYRIGQAMYNVANKLYPLFAREIVGTKSDPYYDDRNIPAFLNTLDYYIKEKGEN